MVTYALPDHVLAADGMLLVTWPDGGNNVGRSTEEASRGPPGLRRRRHLLRPPGQPGLPGLPESGRP